MISRRFTLRRCIDSWNSWWFRRGPAELMGIFRIVFGGYLFCYWAARLPYVHLLYSTDGLVTPYWRPEELPEYLRFFVAVPDPSTALFLLLVFCAALLLVTLGIGMRVAGIIAVLFNAYYWILSLHVFGTSYDRLYLFTLLVLACSGADRAFSLRMLWKRGSFFVSEEISVLPQRILAAQITATYLGVGLQKFALPDWTSGMILVNGFMGLWATPLAWYVSRLHIPLWFYDRAVEIIMLFELALPFGLWIRRTRWWFILGTAFFHIGVTLFLGIWWFLILIPANIVFFQPEEVRSFLRHYAPWALR